MGQCTVRLQFPVVRHPKGVGTIHAYGFVQTGEVMTYSKGFEFAAEAIGKFTSLGKQFEADIGDLAAFRLYIYEYVVHLAFLHYPSVCPAISSTMSELMSASETVSLRDSLAWNTTFSICLTLVGEPSIPSCAGSASMSPTFHSTIFR